MADRTRMIVITALFVAVWLAAVALVLYHFSLPTRLGWTSALVVVGVSAGSGLVLWALTRLRRELRVRAAVPDSLLAQRVFGSLDVVKDGEPRSLRPLGMPAGVVATETGLLLQALSDRDPVRVFRGVRAPGAAPTTHVVVAGTTVLLVESVAWPAGRYRLDRDGSVFCDDEPIGQSVRPLLNAVSYWRAVLPRRHRVAALVVVHPSERKGQTRLPTGMPDLAVVRASEAGRWLHDRVGGHSVPSRHAVAALVESVR